jgi:hypothetical protein
MEIIQAMQFLVSNESGVRVLMIFFTSLTLSLSTPTCIPCCLPSLHPSSDLEPDSLLAECNSGCSCARELYNPVCGGDGVMYYSPCHAGCSTLHHTDATTGRQVRCPASRWSQKALFLLYFDWYNPPDICSHSESGSADPMQTCVYIL